MKKSFVTLLGIVLFMLSGSVYSQNLHEILNKYYQATGIEKWAKVTTVVMNATVEQMGMELPMEMKMKAPNKFRMDMEIQGQKMVQAYDGEKGWMIMPWISAEPQDLEGAQLKQAMDQADREGELYNYEKKGSKAELIGKETIEGKEYFNIKLVDKNETVKNYYIDASTYLLGRVKAKVNTMGQELEIEQIMVEYMAVNGINIPKKIESKTAMGSGIVSFTDVKFDVPVDDSIFKKPAK